MTTWIRNVVLMLAVLAFASPVGAQTENARLGRVLGERAQAAANLSTQVENARTSALARSELESALTARGQALNKALLASQPSVDGASGGFDWTAAGGGAGATLALVLAALGSVFLVRRSRRAATGAAVVIASLCALAVAAATAAAFAAAAGPSFTAWSPAQKIDEIPGNHPDLNTPFTDGCPIQSPDGLSLYMASNRPGGKGGLDIWVSTRASTGNPWGAPVNLPEPINSASDDFCPTPVRGNGLFFVSRKAVEGVTCGLGDIYFARRNPTYGWSDPRHLACAPGGPNSALDEQGPSYAQGRLYFSRSSAVVLGDLYVSQQNGRMSFGTATPIAELNDAGANDIQPNVRKDGREIVFSSNRAGGLGGQDIWSATRASVQDPWSAPVNLGSNVNTALGESRPALSWDAQQLLFGRAGPAGTGEGGTGMSDIYVSTREKSGE